MNKKVTDILPPQKAEKEKEKEIKIEKESPPSLKTLASQVPTPPFKKGLIFSLFFLILLGAFCYLSLSKAEIEIWPETKILNLETKLTIDKEAKEPNFLAKIIPAQVFQKETILTEVFQSSGKVFKEEKAEGTISVYNNYSTSPQILIATTRFVSSDGKVFRTPIRVTIPGGNYEKGKFVPGEIDIKVIADQPGTEYNIDPANFSIPGLAGSDKYTKFYGKSFQPMAGGLRSEVFKVTKEDLTRAEDFLTKQAKKECEELLKSELQSEEISSKFNYFLRELRTEIIEKFSLVLPEEEIKEFKFQVKARCETLLFQKEDLKNFAKELIIYRASQQRGESEDENEFLIAQQILQETSVGEEDKSSSSATELLRSKSEGKEENEVFFAFAAARVVEESLKIDYFSETVNLDSGQIILFLNISAKIYSEVDVYNFKNALVGKSLLETKIFLENQPKISKVNVKLWPFWVRKVPEDLNKIKIDLVF